MTFTAVLKYSGVTNPIISSYKKPNPINLSLFFLTLLKNSKIMTREDTSVPGPYLSFGSN